MFCFDGRNTCSCDLRALENREHYSPSLDLCIGVVWSGQPGSAVLCCAVLCCADWPPSVREDTLHQHTPTHGPSACQPHPGQVENSQRLLHTNQRSHLSAAVFYSNSRPRCFPPVPPVGFAHSALAYPSEHSQLAGVRN